MSLGQKPLDKVRPDKAATSSNEYFGPRQHPKERYESYLMIARGGSIHVDRGRGAQH